ncbi:MAG: response regulator [Trichocoleus desertorum ATA4-8-CV12]|jgi:CheY-like chemotaxis protein|nr:response regulator [Trichocoleus desertorum ATA4-8-CV12]
MNSTTVDTAIEPTQLRILLAEDHLVNQKVALLLLKQLGYRADVARNGLEVLEALHRQAYDVILMDIQMPQMDGLETARCISQEWPPNRRPWIIAVTANGMPGDREMCLEAGMDDYISKPIRIEELSKALLRGQPKWGDRLIQPNTDPVAVDSQVIQAFRNMVGEDASGIFVELINSYLQETPKVIQAMQTALTQDDVALLCLSAHTLKSSSATLGASNLAGLCKDLEICCREAAPMSLTAKVALVEVEFTRVKTALEVEQKRCLP